MHNRHDIFLFSDSIGSSGATIEERDHALSMESKFKLLELEELVHAKKSSKLAMWIAIIAIFISIIGLGWNIYVTSQVSEVIINNPEIKNLDLIESLDNTVNENSLQLQEITRLLEQSKE